MGRTLPRIYLRAVSAFRHPRLDCFFFFFLKRDHTMNQSFVVPLKNVVSSMADPSQIVLSHHYM